MKCKHPSQYLELIGKRREYCKMKKRYIDKPLFKCPCGKVGTASEFLNTKGE